MTDRLFVLVAPLLFVACVGPGGGGCPFTEHSDTTVEPATSCVKSRVTNGEDGSTAGGCVDPDVAITNTCSEALVVHDVVLVADPKVTASGAPGDVTIAPGATTYVETAGKGATDYAIAATLGKTELTIRFSTSRD